MSVLRIAAAASFALSIALVGGASADESIRPGLRFDPFVRPALEVPVKAPAASTRDEWAPVVTATLVAGDRSLADLGGVVLGIGEESHGYRLLEVDVWQAVFEHGGERKVLPVTAREGDR